jgi:hypothetical protein
MNRQDEIRDLLKVSRKLLSNQSINEELTRIKSTYGMITEDLDDMDRVSTDYETAEVSDEEMDNKDEENKTKSDKTRGYKISGGVMMIHSKDKSQLQLTSDDKKAFQDSMNEFRTDVSELVEFNKLNVYDSNVEWSGKINEMDLDFFFSIGESTGVYINSEMSKVDEDFIETLKKIQAFYEKFKSKWSKVLADRKKLSEI